MRILGVERDTTACGYYRIAMPLYMLKEHQLANTMMLNQEDAFNADWAFQKVIESDMILLPRPSSEEWFNFINAVSRAGKTVVCDYDDNPFKCSPWNPYYRWIGVEEFDFKWPDGRVENVWKDGIKGPDGSEFFNIEKNINRRDMLRASFASADMITCTTEPLREEFSKLNPNVKVLPNFVDFSFYPKAELVKHSVRVGWQGGVSHYEDLHMVRPALASLSKQHDDAEFIYFGDHRFNKLFKGVNNFEHEHFVHHNAFPYKLTLMNLDIGLAPLVDNEFNRCKSSIKYYEYSVLKIPTVASNVQPYNEVIEDGRDGLLVENTEKGWVDGIERLIKDKRFRKKLAKNAYEKVYEKHNMDTQIHRWKEAYEEVLNRDKVVV